MTVHLISFEIDTDGNNILENNILRAVYNQGEGENCENIGHSEHIMCELRFTWFLASMVCI